MSDAPWTGDACSLVDAFRAGERSPLEELDASLDAIAASDLNRPFASFTAAAAPSPHAPGKIGQPPRQVRTPEQNSVPRTGPPQSSRSFLLCQNLPTAESLDD
jgi:aspartyl-tRNA(Asn)/glutamyl-tRNA(Gln) amidotransferase subunit A